MSFTVKDIIEGKPEPVTVRNEEQVRVALDRMIEGGFTQLPVLGEKDEIEGIVSSDSILKALDNFDLTINELRVGHALKSVPILNLEDDFFELLDSLKNNHAVLVKGRDRKLIGIITYSDTTKYFRTRGEDLMLVEDIETSIKEYICSSFENDENEVDRDSLEKAIEAITPSSSASFKKSFGKALHESKELGLASLSEEDHHRLEKIFERHFVPEVKPKPFDRLSLGEYIDLFLLKDRWAKFSSIFKMSEKACRRILDSVRDTRNALAHFRADLSPKQREQLRFCRDWLARYQDAFENNIFEQSAQTQTLGAEDSGDWKLNESTDKWNALKKSVRNIHAIDFERDQLKINDVEQRIPTQSFEVNDPEESKYAKLAKFLEALDLETQKIRLSFSNIETIIGTRLPGTAREHRAWWANDSNDHEKSRLWLAAGWRVSSVNLSAERVTFSRIKERERQYVRFFSRLLAGLRETDEFRGLSVSPSGRNFITIDRLKSEELNTNITHTGFSFSRGNRFRSELYIDSGQEEVNDAVYSMLKSNEIRIFRSLNEEISWERLDNRRGSRIAIYVDGAITDSDEKLEEIKEWAINAMRRMHSLFHQEMKDDILTAAVSAQSLAEEPEKAEQTAG